MSKRFHIVGDTLRGGRPYILDEAKMADLLKDFGAEDRLGPIQDLEIGQISETGVPGSAFVIRVADDIPLTTL